MKNRERFKFVRVGRAPRAGQLKGFTLIEVMISLALVLLLTYGIAQVFSLSSQTVGVTTAVQNIVRDHRAAVTTLMDDFRNCANDSPLFLIDSQVAYDGAVGTTPAPRKEVVGSRTITRGYLAGFRNALEESQSTDPNHDPTRIEVNGKQLFVDFNTYTDRTPRMDRLGFFARGLYRRQTMSNSQVYSATTSNEAYIWYGHTALPGYAAQGAGVPQKGTPYANGYYMTLPQNQYAQDRILGRIAILLKDRSTIPNAEFGDALGGTGLTAPLDWDSRGWLSYSDLGNATMDQWRTAANLQYQTNFKTWYWTMDDDNRTGQKLWWANCQPVLERPITPQKMAQTAPCFIPHCTQFMVEYAGDYLAQDPSTGAVTDAGAKMNAASGLITGGRTDGEIDYVLDTTIANQPVKRVRWYGLPRDTDGDGKIGILDVLPLADVMGYYGIGGAVAPWEKVLPTPGLTGLGGDYSRFKTANGMSPQNFRYVCAWHNDAPPMIRILMKFDDPAGRLQEGQWYEYVLSR